jgi:hypothetical protein
LSGRSSCLYFAPSASGRSCARSCRCLLVGGWGGRQPPSLGTSIRHRCPDHRGCVIAGDLSPPRARAATPPRRDRRADHALSRGRRRLGAKARSALPNGRASDTCPLPLRLVAAGGTPEVPIRDGYPGDRVIGPRGRPITQPRPSPTTGRLCHPSAGTGADTFASGKDTVRAAYVHITFTGNPMDGKAEKGVTARRVDDMYSRSSPMRDI